MSDWSDLATLVTAYRAPLISLAFGLLLFALAPKLVGLSRGADQARTQSVILRGVLVAFMGLQIVDIVLHQTLADDYDRLLLKASISLALVYALIVVFNIFARLLQMKFGKTREIDGKTTAVASYHSRMATVILVVLMGLFAVLAAIEIWDMASLIEKTGFIGIIAAFVVLTNAVWFPDLYFGMTLLGSSMAEEGDTIQLDEEKPLYIINRLTPFYALLLNVDTNERVILRNSRLFDGPIENLSKRASIDGLRRRVDLKISYPKDESSDDMHAKLFARLDKAVSAAFERVSGQQDSRINANVPFAWLMAEAGNDALRFSVFYNLAPLPETKLTKVVRSFMRQTPAAVTQALYQECSARGLHLATPGLVKLSGTLSTTAQESVPPTDDSRET